MKRIHRMPFGAQILDDGRVRFRLWAPAAKQVELCIQDTPDEGRLQLAPETDGWFGIRTEMAIKGSYYQYCIDGKHHVPDPASRFQPEDVHGSSQVIDPAAWEWTDTQWLGRPWEQTVIYELHVGTFTPEGTFSGVKNKLDYLKQLGITALQLMPIADFPGKHNWGYDGVYPFAPENAYGTPEELKDLIQTAHSKGLMVFLDVVYNHFGPEGNYITKYAPQFHSRHHHTPWGAGFNFDEPENQTARQFFIHNALYWLEEFHFDGLRLDAVHTIQDDSDVHFLSELAQAVHDGPGRDRHIHLILENDDNNAHYLNRDDSGKPTVYTAQWNDDLHHVLHLILTGETGAYYQDYAQESDKHLRRCLTEGFSYQGETSPYRKKSRGESSAHLPPTAFIAFLQNHDHVGNRALGERITAISSSDAVRAATAIVLLSPEIPLLFMGQEWAAKSPFPFFCDLASHFGKKAVKGRLNELKNHLQFNRPENIKRSPNPTDHKTFQSAVLDWHELNQSHQKEWLEFHKNLLSVRQQEIIPLLSDLLDNVAVATKQHPISIVWTFGEDKILNLVANLTGEAAQIEFTFTGKFIYTLPQDLPTTLLQGTMPGWSVAWFMS
jgi:1,4-alpha-glucan branching enzyme/maltooligosyltrehalose trehalohydrolase